MTRRILDISFRILALALAAGFFSAASAEADPVIAITGTTAGAQPFISFLSATVTPASAIPDIKTISFTVSPKAGSKTRPISATYSLAYLTSRGYVGTSGTITIPVFGLYANRLNTVTLAYTLTSGLVEKADLQIQTAPFNDTTTGQIYLNPTIVEPRADTPNLSYDFILLKSFVTPANSPIILDTDAEVRWAGTAGFGSIPSIFYDNGVYVSGGSNLIRMELDGTYTTAGQYSDLGVVDTSSHNFDPGKYGFVMEVDTPGDFECTNMETDACGNIIKIWPLAEIVASAMIQGGDDPSAFVRPTVDWFHDNATTYRSSDDSEIISSRENFVICLDYNTNKIKWILGDPTKAWYTYPSLRKYALTLTKGSLPPIGQHAVSITKSDNLLLFDDGTASVNQTPAGASRTYSAVREYSIDTQKMTATEVATYADDEKIYNAYTGSVYEDAPGNYLIDWAMEADGNTELMGIVAGVKVFDYTYPTLDFAGTGWNAIPIHLEDLKFQ
jgi:hypothetical protein